MRRKLLVATVALFALLAVGYGSAYGRMSDCGDDFLGELRSRKISGHTLSGEKVAPSVTLALIRVAGPFIVRATVTVPRDLHATTYTARYVALPWGVMRISFEEVSYV
jgi:hypothetical protein